MGKFSFVNDILSVELIHESTHTHESSVLVTEYFTKVFLVLEDIGDGNPGIPRIVEMQRMKIRAKDSEEVSSDNTYWRLLTGSVEVDPQEFGYDNLGDKL